MATGSFCQLLWMRCDAVTGRFPPVAAIVSGRIERIPCISFVVLPRRSPRFQRSLLASADLDFHYLFTSRPYPQLPSGPPIAPNRDPVQPACMGRAVLKQQHHRSYHPAHKVEEGALAS
jgi:hypothetical protein